jgi:hypothetical protein
MNRRVMWAVVVACGAALYVGCTPCVSSGRPADAIAPVTISDGGIGDPCDTSSQCSAGLDCRGAFPVTDSYTENSTFRACTRECETSACPTGSVCADANGQTAPDGGLSRQCVPGCAKDTDCLTGHRAGSCIGEDGGTLADGGSLADGGVQLGQCRPIVCGGTTSVTCPSGYLCQDDRTYNRGGSCGTSSSGAAMAAPQASWCGK